MKKLFQLTCPVCGELLQQGGKTYICSQGHSFDIARKGYVNLLLGSAKGHHGDDALMVRARTDFLNKGHYDKLSAAICDSVRARASAEPMILDAGCGEGKYTADLYRCLTEAGKSPSVLALDISKDAVLALMRREKDLQAVVASAAQIPAESSSADFLINIFAPFFREEFLRVLKPGGYLIRVVPLEDHLIELKQFVYDNAYLNDVPDYEEAGFEIEEKQRVCYKITLGNNEEIRNLFLMTPYYYKTGVNDQKKLDTAHQLEVTLDFQIILYKKLEI